MWACQQCYQKTLFYKVGNEFLRSAVIKLMSHPLYRQVSCVLTLSNCSAEITWNPFSAVSEETWAACFREWFERLLKYVKCKWEAINIVRLYMSCYYPIFKDLSGILVCRWSNITFHLNKICYKYVFDTRCGRDFVRWYYLTLFVKRNLRIST